MEAEILLYIFFGATGTSLLLDCFAIEVSYKRLESKN